MLRGVDVFAPGNERLTPKEIGRIDNPWRMRWIPNKYPFAEHKSHHGLKKKFFKTEPAYGHHELIVETPTKKQLWDFTEAEIKELLQVYAQRIKEISKDKKIKYVQVFKNHGREAGASIVHSHTQIVATAMIPPQLEEELAASKKFGKYCYKKILTAERQSPRRCFETKNVLAFTPFASRFNYEVWVFPKRYVKNMDSLSGRELQDTAMVLKKILAKLKMLNAPYNMFLHYAPKGKDLHMHFEITPRLQGWAGYELAAGIIINEVSPEEAARFYRSK